MKKREMVNYAIRNIQQTEIRSWLTMLGIFIGILSIVVLIGLADGLKSEISSELDSFGSNSIVITPISTEGLGQSSGFSPTKGKLFEKDYQKIQKVSGIEYISRVIYGRTNVGFKDEELAMAVYGVEADVFEEVAGGSVEIEKGRFLEGNEQGSVVIGNYIATEAFDKTVEVNSQLEIDGKIYKVVGILKKTGNSFFNPDNIVFISYKESQKIFENILATNEISAIRLIVEDGQDTQEVADEVTDILLSTHKVNEEDKDFSVVTSEFINEQVGEITGLLTLFLGAVAGIALVVGGIGISNTMFMNVIERTKEIGVLKAIGAKNDEVVSLFIIESLILGLIGGIAGIVFGAILLMLITLITGITTLFSPSVAVIALIFSALVGVGSGWLPAKNAAEISPVEALRYE